MKKTLLYFCIWAIGFPGASYAESCLMQGTILGKPLKECLTNVSMPKDGFDALCTVWEKKPVPGIESKTTYVASCPEDYAGYCVTTFAGSGNSMKHYFYNQAIVERSKKSCGAVTPMTSGVWHDR
jgi:hypothetical protein